MSGKSPYSKILGVVFELGFDHSRYILVSILAGTIVRLSLEKPEYSDFDGLLDDTVERLRIRALQWRERWEREHSQSKRPDLKVIKGGKESSYEQEIQHNG